MFRSDTSPSDARGQVQAVDETPFVPMLPMAGQWSFADLDWNFASRIVDRNEIDALHDASSDAPKPDNLNQFPEVNEELTELAEMLKLRPVDRGGNQIYRLDRADVVGQLVVREHKAISLAAAFPQGDGSWKLFELIQGHSTDKTKRDQPHLLPLPSDARRTSGRYGDDGRLLLELASLNSNTAELLSLWKAAGWDVHPSGLAQPDQFSFLCARGGEVIYVWSADQANSLRSLMMVHTPDVAP